MVQRGLNVKQNGMMFETVTLQRANLNEQIAGNPAHHRRVWEAVAAKDIARARAMMRIRVAVTTA